MPSIMKFGKKWELAVQVKEKIEKIEICHTLEKIYYKFIILVNFIEYK